MNEAVTHQPSDLHAVLQDLAAMLRKQTQAVPFEYVLWTPDEIAAHLQVSPRTVAEKYAPRPGFPRPVHPGGGHARWYAAEVIDWIETSRVKKPRGTRN